MVELTDARFMPDRREIIPAGDSMVLETAGGGGRGDPAERDPDAIADDTKNELL